MEGIVRKANCDVRSAFASMIMLSALYFQYLFGPKAGKMFETLFCIKGTPFSCEFVKTLYLDNTPAGMILSYGWESRKQCSLKTGFYFFRYATEQIIGKLSVFLKLNNSIGKLNPGDYYISNLAVFPTFRSKGGGKLLIRSAEKEARLLNMKFLVLNVESENERAIGLYRHFGLGICRTFDIDIGRNTTLQFFWMKKLLN